MGYHCTLFTEMFGKLLYTLEPPLIKVLLSLDAVGNGGEQRYLILHALHIFCPGNDFASASFAELNRNHHPDITVGHNFTYIHYIIPSISFWMPDVFIS